MSAQPVDVLVVGAGPTGLATALQAHDHGARVRVIERRTESFRPSRALVMHPRTLEVLRPLRVTDALLGHGDVSPSAELHLGSRVVAVQLEELDLPDTAFPHLLLIRQADVERVLWRGLADRGVEVEWGVELTGLRRGPDEACASVRREGASSDIECRYVAGCDGAASAVRRWADVRWRGRPYTQEAVLADIELDGDLAPGVAHVVPGGQGLVFLFAIGERATWRLLATRPGCSEDLPFGEPGPAVPAGELQRLLDGVGLDARITEVGWSARVPLQHRIASRYRCGPLFLAGDAAHASSPAGAQGMNTGIQDGLNLGWKLALSARRPRPVVEAALDSYEVERRPVARRVLAMTHAVFWAEASTDPVAVFARRVMAWMAGPVVPLLMRRRRLLAASVRTLSQLRVHYRHSPLSLEGTPRGLGAFSPGDRVPDMEVTSENRRLRLHELLARPGIHVLLQRDAAGLDELCLGGDVRVHRITSWRGTGVVLVRPDGYVGYRCGVADPDQMTKWLALVTGTGARAARSPGPVSVVPS